MPTGYTNNVSTGEVTEFRTFVLQCARAFGALIAMRDEPQDAPIPDKLEPYPWNKDQLNKAQTSLSELLTLTPEQVELQAFRTYNEQLQAYFQFEKERNTIQARYELMLVKVRAWIVPSTDHKKLKQFMIDQLEKSIKSECSYSLPEPKRLSGSDWLANMISELERTITYHSSEWENEVKRTEERNSWLAILRNSLV
jgi:hypothetical protein